MPGTITIATLKKFLAAFNAHDLDAIMEFRQDRRADPRPCVDLLEFRDGSWSRRTPIGNHRQVNGLRPNANVGRRTCYQNEGQTCIK